MHRMRTQRRGMDVFQGQLWPEPEPPPRPQRRRPDPAGPLDGDVALCVLASSSQGNCSVLIHRRAPDLYRLTLIDAGLSPRRTRLILSQLGLDVSRIDDVIFTHLDLDHCRPTWRRALPPHARFHIHRRHRGRAERMGLLTRRTELFEDDAFPLRHAIVVTPVHLAHDDLGVASFRFDFGDEQRSSLGYATDVGRATDDLTDILADVDVLAIESNYCPVMQEQSDRPWFLKQRIMGGRGHLSNHESCEAVRRIAPRRHLVLLHLSQECNTPATALRHHADHACPVIAASPSRPSPFIHVAGPSAAGAGHIRTSSIPLGAAV